MMKQEQFTRYEKARIIGARALQIAMDAPILLKMTKEELEEIKYDAIKIAELELSGGILPITIHRPNPRRGKERLDAIRDEELSDEELIEKEKEVEKEINSFKEIKNVEIKSFEDLNKVENLIKKKFNLKNFKEFGANSLFALESAILKALAKSLKKELWWLINSNASKLPFPLGNAVGGGVHSYNKNKPEFQEFLLIPRERKFETNLKIMNETYLKLGKILKSKKKNDEGAWECNKSNEEILEILGKFKDIKIGIDVASSTFYRNENYYYKKRIFDRETQIRYI